MRAGGNPKSERKSPFFKSALQKMVTRAACLVMLGWCGLAAGFSPPSSVQPLLRGLALGSPAADVCRISPRACRSSAAPSNMYMLGEGGLLSKVPRPSLPQLAYAALTFTAGQNILSGIFNGSFDRPALLDILIFVVSGYFLRQTFAKVDYTKLDGLEENSLAAQAGKWALEGEVPTHMGEYQVATFAGGCFWGTELHYQRIPGVVATCVGYTQGAVDQPNYQQVCSGSTGHTEGIQLVYDAKEVSYEQLCSKLLSTVDATRLNAVGNDRGTQYRHGIYPHTAEQAEVAERLLKDEQLKYSQPVVTELKTATVFWPAENYHQRYLQKGGQSAAKNAPEAVRCYG